MNTVFIKTKEKYRNIESFNSIMDFLTSIGFYVTEIKIQEGILRGTIDSTNINKIEDLSSVEYVNIIH